MKTENEIRVGNLVTDAGVMEHKKAMAFDSLLKLFFRHDGYVYWSFIEDITVNSQDSELAEFMYTELKKKEESYLSSLKDVQREN